MSVSPACENTSFRFSCSTTFPVAKKHSKCCKRQRCQNNKLNHTLEELLFTFLISKRIGILLMDPTVYLLSAVGAGDGIPMCSFAF